MGRNEARRAPNEARLLSHDVERLVQRADRLLLRTPVERTRRLCALARAQHLCRGLSLQHSGTLRTVPNRRTAACDPQRQASYLAVLRGSCGSAAGQAQRGDHVVGFARGSAWAECIRTVRTCCACYACCACRCRACCAFRAWGCCACYACCTWRCCACCTCWGAALWRGCCAGHCARGACLGEGVVRLVYQRKRAEGVAGGRSCGRQ